MLTTRATVTIETGLLTFIWVITDLIVFITVVRSPPPCLPATDTDVPPLSA